MNALEALDFLAHDGSFALGLVSVWDESPGLPVDQQIAIREVRALADRKDEIDYVFFRRFADDRSAHVAAYIIDNRSDRLSEAELADIHRRAWLQGHSPLLYVAWETRVDILSCAGEPAFWHNGTSRYSPSLPPLQLAAEVSRELERFSAHRLADGTFWEDPANSGLADADNNSHALLIKAVIETDLELNGEHNPVLRRLLLIVILIKYLEDRRVFPYPEWFAHYHTGARCFFDVLEHGSPESVCSLLSDLETRFNGDVFKLPTIDTLALTEQDLKHFATLVRADTLMRQQNFWKLFDFRYIPIEVISHLYQHFAQSDKAAIFTPPFVVSLMLDYALPYGAIPDQIRILDPTCGSGAFLVSAFRRLINQRRSNSAWRQLDVDELKALLRSSIFGIEIQEDALHLTAFNLALAICDALQPEIIWDNLTFDVLAKANGNLRVGDFFQIQKAPTLGQFDLIIGNPPFMERLGTPGAQEAYNIHSDDQQAIPAKQLAYLVARVSLDLLREGGQLCLIQPSGFLYNANTQAFRSNYIKTSRLDAILDFTSIRGLYVSADTKTIAILVTKAYPSTDHAIRHYTFRRTTSARQQIFFELDHYDRHLVPQTIALRYRWVWRCNLLGGGRLFHLAVRLSKMRTLADYIKKQEWDYGEGYIAASKGNRQPEPWLTGRPLLPTDAFNDDGIDPAKCIGRTVEETLFRSAYSESRYTGPIILYKENWSLPLVFLRDGFLAYKAKIVGISAKNGGERKLRTFYRKMLRNRKLIRALACIFGTQILMGKATAFLKSDIDSVPWPVAREGWGLSGWEEILCEDIVDYMADFIRLGQGSRLLSESASDTNLADYSDVFLRSVGSVYKPVRRGLTRRSGNLISQSFHFGEPVGNSPEQDLDDFGWIENVIYNRRSETLCTVRMLRIYQGNEVVVVKPNRLRYWIRSTALWDADETIKELVGQGL